MENEILQQILQKLDSMDNRLNGIENEQKEMRQDITSLRHAQMLFEHNITKKLGAMEDGQQIIIDMGKAAINLMHEAKALTDENIQEQTVLALKIRELEKKVG